MLEIEDHSILFQHHDKDVQKMLTTDNAGGSSVISEALSFYLVRDLFHHMGYYASLHRTEMEIEYIPGSKITDYSVIIPNLHENIIIGCSVVRFFNYRDLNLTIHDDEIMRLLTKKLDGINESSRNVVSESWNKQILHIITPNNRLRRKISKCITTLDTDLVLNTTIFITVTSNRKVYYKY